MEAPNIRFRDAGKKIEFTAEELEVISDSGTTKVLEKLNTMNNQSTSLESRISTLETKTLPISLSMPSIPPVPLEHQFATSIYVNGVRSTTVPHNDGVYIGKDTNNASSVEMVSEICYIDFIHLPGSDYTNRILSNSDGIHFTGDTHMNNVKIGNSIQKNNTKTEYGGIGETIKHYGNLHYFYGNTTNYLQDTQVIIKNGSLKIENIVLERDDNNSLVARERGCVG